MRVSLRAGVNTTIKTGSSPDSMIQAFIALLGGLVADNTDAQLNTCAAARGPRSDTVVAVLRMTRNTCNY